MSVNTPEPKVPVVRRSGWTISLELIGGQTIGHVDVHVPLTPRRVAELEADMALVFELHGGPIWAPHIEEMGDKHLKFLKLFQFAYGFTAPRSDGLGSVDFYVRPREITQWRQSQLQPHHS